MQYQAFCLYGILLLLFILPSQYTLAEDPCPACGQFTVTAPGFCNNEHCILGTNDPEEQASQERVRTRVQRDIRRKNFQIQSTLVDQIGSALLPIHITQWQSQLAQLQTELIPKSQWENFDIDVQRVLFEMEYRQSLLPPEQKPPLIIPEWLNGMHNWSTNSDPDAGPALEEADRSIRQSGLQAVTIGPNQGQNPIVFIKQLLAFPNQRFLLTYRFVTDSGWEQQYYLIQTDSEGMIFAFSDIEGLDSILSFNTPQEFIQMSIQDYDASTGDTLTVRSYSERESRSRTRREMRAPSPD
jgi:hypothetical protein